MQFFFSFGCPNLRGGGGGDLVGPKDQIFPMRLFEGSPNSVSLKPVDEKLVDKAWDLLWVHSDVQRDMEGKLKV